MTIATSELIDNILPLPCTTYPYIYGIIPTDEQIIFDVSGIDNADDVYTIRHAGLSVVISNVAEHNFQGMSRQVALQRLAAHQRVIEAVMGDYPVLPVKFGTILADEANVHNLLTQGATLFAKAFTQYANKRQFELIVLWELPLIFAAISVEPEIVALKARIESQASQATTADRVAFGMAVEAALERRRAELNKQVIAMVVDITDDLVINPTMDESMVANLALLIDDVQAGALDDRLQQLDLAFHGQFQIRCVGPLPPYSFATVGIQATAFEAIDSARRRLELEEVATASEIKHAYRTHAALVHPDRNTLDDAEERMAALTKAYKLLSMYAEGQAMQPQTSIGTTPSDQLCWFRRESVERTLLITISRQDAAQEPAR